MEINRTLFDNIMSTVQDCVFWKDKERRFVGVNQAFLDFYGFESEDVLIGKTDEDMGWHNDTEPFKQDELRVLAGENTYKVAGKCIIRGEERDIIASKNPIYENGEIVGLVGSFLDVTEALRRERGANNAQIMYDRERLKIYPYFSRILDDAALDEVLDSLTGIISRHYILGFAKALINEGRRFTFAIVDLDNFKFFNDTYGHQSGDKVLMDVSANLANYIGEKGLVGRFGGDELIIINLVDCEYDEKQAFFEGMYSDGKVLRKNITLEGNDVMITGTIGSATYPDDAGDYNGLFTLIDKTLYCGKSKGRNCFVVYIESEHKDIEIKDLAKRSLYVNMNAINKIFEGKTNILTKLKKCLPIMTQELQTHDILCVAPNGIMTSVVDTRIREDVSDIEAIMDDDIFCDNSLDAVKEKAPKLSAVLEKFNAHAIIIARIGIRKETEGYIICASDAILRLWQEDDCALVYFLAKAVATSLKIENETISL